MVRISWIEVWQHLAMDQMIKCSVAVTFLPHGCAKPKIGRSPISLSYSLRTFKVHIKFHGRPVRTCGPESWLDVKISVIIPRLCCEQHKKCEMSRTVWTTEMLNTSHSNVGSKIMKNINHAWYIHPPQFNVYGTFVLTRFQLFLI